MKLSPLSPGDPCGLLFLLQGGEGKGSACPAELRAPGAASCADLSVHHIPRGRARPWINSGRLVAGAESAGDGTTSVCAAARTLTALRTGRTAVGTEDSQEVAAAQQQGLHWVSGLPRGRSTHGLHVLPPKHSYGAGLPSCVHGAVPSSQGCRAPHGRPRAPGVRCVPPWGHLPRPEGSSGPPPIQEAPCMGAGKGLAHQTPRRGPEQPTEPAGPSPQYD